MKSCRENFQVAIFSQFLLTSAQRSGKLGNNDVIIKKRKVQNLLSLKLEVKQLYIITDYLGI